MAMARMSCIQVMQNRSALCNVLCACSRGPSPSLVLGGCCLGLPWGCPVALPDGATEVLAGLCASKPWFGCDQAGI